jgi:hypothetical protein
MEKDINPLLAKLAAAKFTGTLELRLESGQLTSARLEHFLPFSELGRQLVTVEPETAVIMAGNHKGLAKIVDSEPF